MVNHPPSTLADGHRPFQLVDTLQHLESNIPTEVAPFGEKGADDLEGGATALALYECAQPRAEVEDAPVLLDPWQRIERRTQIWQCE